MSLEDSSIKIKIEKSINLQISISISILSFNFNVPRSKHNYRMYSWYDYLFSSKIRLLTLKYNQLINIQILILTSILIFNSNVPLSKHDYQIYSWCDYFFSSPSRSWGEIVRACARIDSPDDPWQSRSYRSIVTTRRSSSIISFDGSRWDSFPSDNSLPRRVRYPMWKIIISYRSRRVCSIERPISIDRRSLVFLSVRDRARNFFNFFYFNVKIK